MTTPRRWIAWTNTEGELDAEPRPYKRPEEDGGSVLVRTDGEFFFGIDRRPEGAVEYDRREWRSAAGMGPRDAER